MIGIRTRSRSHHGHDSRQTAEVIDTPADQAFASTLAAARANAAWAWESIYHDLAPRVLGWLRMEQPEHAEDLLGDTFLCVVRDIHDFAGNERAFQAWVFRIARNRMLDAARSRARRPVAAHVDAGLPAEHADVAPDAAEQVMRRLERERIASLLDVLPEDQRATIYLRFVLDATFAEVADALGVSVAAAKMLQQRALRTLGQRLPWIIAV